MRFNIIVLLLLVVSPLVIAQKKNPEIEFIKSGIENMYNNWENKPMTAEQYKEKQLVLYTERFFDFKNDIRDLPGNPTPQDLKTFENKWGKIYIKYNLKFNEQHLLKDDWDIIVVSNIKLISKTKDFSWYSITVSDSVKKENYYKKIKLIPYNESWRIDEVRDYKLKQKK